MIKKPYPPYWHIQCNTGDCGKVFGVDTPGVSLAKRRIDPDTARLMTQFSWHVDGPRHYCPACCEIAPLYQCRVHDNESVYPMNVSYYVHHRDIANAYGWEHEVDGRTVIECIQCQHADTPGWVAPACQYRHVPHSWARIGDTLRCITPLCEQTMKLVKLQK